MENNNVSKYIKFGVFIFIGLVILLVSFTIVSPGEYGVVVRIGNVNRTIGSGMHFKIPLMESVYKFDVRTQKEQVDADSASSDLQTVKATIAVNYGLDGTKVANLYQTVGDEYKERIIDPSIQEAVKASTANYTAEELITKRENVREEIKTLLESKLQPYGITLADISIVNFTFSDTFNTAIEAKVTAEQNALASKNKLEQVQYEADQRVAQAKGEAEAIKIQAEAITQQGGEAYVKLQAIDKWDGKLPVNMYGNGAVPFVDVK